MSVASPVISDEEKARITFFSRKKITLQSFFFLVCTDLVISSSNPTTIRKKYDAATSIFFGLITNPKYRVFKHKIGTLNIVRFTILTL